MDNKMYKVVVQAQWGSTVRDESFRMPLGWQDYHVISGSSSGDAAKRLGRMLCPSADNIIRVYVTEA